MTIIPKRLLTLAMLLMAGHATAQNFLWDVKFDPRFDNREYKSELSIPQTLFGARLTPQIGIGWGKELNYIKIGTDLMADFGASPFNTKPDWIAYYGYESPKFKAYTGVFPREKMMGTYNSAFFSDSVKYYDTNLEGLLMQYVFDRGYVEFGCDWNSMLGQDRREKFMLFSSFQYNLKLFNFGYNFDMYHHAGTVTEDGVVDNVLINPFICLDLQPITSMQKLYLRTGLLQAFQNDRKYVGHYVSPRGALIELGVQKWNFGVYNALYLGQDLMPYYTEYPGADLYFGEPWFRTRTGIYDRLELYWNPVHRKDMDLYVASVHHYDGKKWGWQQVIELKVWLNQGSFKKRHGKWIVND